MKKQILSLVVALLIGTTVCIAQNRPQGQQRKVDRENDYRSGTE